MEPNKGSSKSPDRAARYEPTDWILGMSEVVQITGVSRATIYAWMDAGIFPKASKLGLRRIGWRASQIYDWIARSTGANPAGATDATSSTLQEPHFQTHPKSACGASAGEPHKPMRGLRTVPVRIPLLRRSSTLRGPRAHEVFANHQPQSTPINPNQSHENHPSHQTRSSPPRRCPIRQPLNQPLVCLDHRGDCCHRCRRARVGMWRR